MTYIKHQSHARPLTIQYNPFYVALAFQSLRSQISASPAVNAIVDIFKVCNPNDITFTDCIA